MRPTPTLPAEQRNRLVRNCFCRRITTIGGEDGVASKPHKHQLNPAKPQVKNVELNLEKIPQREIPTNMNK